MRLTSLLPILHKACRGQAKGVFANLIAGLTLGDLVYSPGAAVQEAHLQAQRHLVAFKILTLLAYSKVDLDMLAVKGREIQMDVVVMRLEETLDVKLQPKELALFKKDFQSFYLVPLATIREKLQLHVEGRGFFEITLVSLLRRMLLEWERFQTQLRKRLLKTFIDFDANGDGVLVLDEFRELMRSLEPAVTNERIVVVFNEALELSDDDADPDRMSPQCFVEAVIRYRLGGHGADFLDLAQLLI